jgi:hypothetical protein
MKVKIFFRKNLVIVFKKEQKKNTDPTTGDQKVSSKNVLKNATG